MRVYAQEYAPTLEAYEHAFGAYGSTWEAYPLALAAYIQTSETEVYAPISEAAHTQASAASYLQEKATKAAREKQAAK